MMSTMCGTIPNLVVTIFTNASEWEVMPYGGH